MVSSKAVSFELLFKFLRHAGAFVAGLLAPRSPAAVRGFVVAVRVDPVEGQPRLPRWAHVFEEVFKLLPAGANANAPPAVVLISSIIAAGPHRYPRAIERVLAHAVGFSVPVTCHIRGHLFFTR